MITILEYWRELSITIGGLGMFIFGRKSAKILERKNNADAVSSMQSTYDVFLKHFETQYNTLLNRLNDLELRNSILLQSSQEWESKFRELEKNHEKLKLEFDNYKKQHEK